MVGVGETGVEVIVVVGAGVPVDMEIDAGAQETRTIAKKMMSNIIVFMSRLEGNRPTRCLAAIVTA